MSEKDNIYEILEDMKLFLGVRLQSVMLIAIGSNVIYVKSLTKIFLPKKEGKG